MIYLAFLSFRLYGSCTNRHIFTFQRLYCQVIRRARNKNPQLKYNIYATHFLGSEKNC